MDYETDHVSVGGDEPTTVRGLSTVTNLIEKPSLARVYATLREGSTTAPDLVDTVEVSKKTVYSYLGDLQRAGLVRETNDDGGASTYHAEDFELTLHLRGVTVSITPGLVDVVARADDYPVIDRVIDDHGVVPLVLAYDLVQGHDEGAVTIRQIAQRTGLSSGTTYDLVEALYDTLELGADDPTPTTFTPDDTDRDDDLVEQLIDE